MWLLGVVVRRYIDFLILYLSLFLLYLLFFCSIIPIFVHFLNVFRSLDYIECREHNLYINFEKYYINNKINKK